MRSIAKGVEPPSLTAHRKTPPCDYDNYTDKDGLRHSLVTEQRCLCCYCMARIHNGRDTMKVEHWRCQARYPEEQLSYRNLLATCRGGEGQPPRLQHCDTRKGDKDLQWNPAEPTHHVETRIRYDADGAIRSDDGAFDAELKDVLNLNLPLLMNNRKRVYDALLDWWKYEKSRRHGPVPRERLERERARQMAGSGPLVPFCQVTIWLLGQKLARMSA